MNEVIEEVIKPTIRVHNVETGEVLDREMTDAEFAQFEKDQKVAAKAEAAKAKAEAEKAALLVRLGLTEDELKIILG
jgi:NADP-dependent 3-hydroxy acid dehydrogenase YdfG